MAFGTHNEQAKVQRWQAMMQNTAAWRGTENGQSVYKPNTGSSYLSRSRPRPQYKFGQSGPLDGLAEQFKMPYQINDQVLAGYQDRETASAGNLASIGKGFADRRQQTAAVMNNINAGYQNRYDRSMNALDSIAGGYGNRLATATDRMDQLQGGYDERYTRAMENLEGSHQGEKDRINQAYKEREARMQQDLVSRGLRNSSVVTGKGLGIEREKQLAMADVGERVRKERLTTDANLSGDALNFGSKSAEYLSRLDNDRLNFLDSANRMDADLSQDQLSFQDSGNRLNAQLSGDQLNFLNTANNTQNSLAGDRLRFHASTKADYPNYEDYMKLTEAMGAAGYGQGGVGGGGYAPRGGYMAAPKVVGLGQYGYQNPMNLVQPVNLRPQYHNRSMGRSEDALNTQAMRRGAMEADRNWRRNNRDYSTNAGRYLGNGMELGLDGQPTRTNNYQQQQQARDWAYAAGGVHDSALDKRPEDVLRLPKTVRPAANPHKTYTPEPYSSRAARGAASGGAVRPAANPHMTYVPGSTPTARDMRSMSTVIQGVTDSLPHPRQSQMDDASRGYAPRTATPIPAVRPQPQPLGPNGWGGGSDAWAMSPGTSAAPSGYPMPRVSTAPAVAPTASPTYAPRSASMGKKGKGKKSVSAYKGVSGTGRYYPDDAWDRYGVLFDEEMKRQFGLNPFGRY